MKPRPGAGNELTRTSPPKASSCTWRSTASKSRQALRSPCLPFSLPSSHHHSTGLASEPEPRVASQPWEGVSQISVFLFILNHLKWAAGFPLARNTRQRREVAFLPQEHPPRRELSDQLRAQGLSPESLAQCCAHCLTVRLSPPTSLLQASTTAANGW